MKTKRFIGCLFFILIMMTGCGTKVDSDGNYSINSKWKLTEFAFDGNRTVLANDPEIVNKMTEDAQPKFECTNNKNCKFTLNGKTHNGTVSREGDGYRITFDDSYKPFLANIDGNKLTLTNENKKVEIIFEAEE